jgi:glycosyltransferase involved in cell wall biosynthesis
MNARSTALVLFEYASLNGGEMSFLSVAPFLSSEFDIRACLLEEGPLQTQLQALSIPHTLLRFAADSTQVEKRATLERMLRGLPLGLVHANSLSMTRLSAPLTRALGIPHFGHLRDIANISRKAIEDISQSERLLAVSQAVRDCYRTAGVPSEKLVVLHNGVSLGEFCPGSRSGPIRRELKLGEAPVVVGIGQLGLRKGFDVWLAAATIIAEQLPDAVFLIAGEQHSQKAETTKHVHELRHRSQQGILAGRVKWLGRRDDIAQLLRESDLLLHCARQEPLGRVLLEALAVGKPIVATDVGGTREILPRESWEFSLAQVDNVAELSSKAFHILNSKQLMEEMSRRHAAHAAAHFSAATAAQRLLEHYHSVCSGNVGCIAESR